MKVTGPRQWKLPGQCWRSAKERETFPVLVSSIYIMHNSWLASSCTADMDSQHDDDEKTCFLCMASLGGKDDASCDSCPIRACTKDHLSVHQAKENDKIICLPFRVGRDKTKGRHFLATRDIAPLELVLTDRPSVVGPPTVTKPTCLGCLDPLTQLMFRSHMGSRAQRGGGGGGFLAVSPTDRISILVVKNVK